MNPHFRLELARALLRSPRPVLQVMIDIFDVYYAVFKGTFAHSGCYRGGRPLRAFLRSDRTACQKPCGVPAGLESPRHIHCVATAADVWNGKSTHVGCDVTGG